MSDRHGKALSRKYSLVAGVSVVPLVIVIVVLAGFQYRAQRDNQLEALQSRALAHNLVLSNVIEAVRDHVVALQSWAEIYLREAPDAASGMPGAAASAGRVVITRPAGGAAEPAPRERALAERLSRHMALTHRTRPYLRHSYFLSAGENLIGMFPGLGAQTWGEGLTEARVEAFMDQMFGSPLFAEAATRTDRRDYWTAPMHDPGGAGWMVANLAPVIADGGLVGVVGSAVLLDFLTGFLRAFDYPAGTLWLVDPTGQILASSRPPPARAQLPQLTEVLPGGPQLDALLGRSGAFQTVNGIHLLVQPVAGTPWRLLYAITRGELAAIILPRFVPYGIILAGLILTLLLAHLLRQKLIVGPALALVDYIRAESRDVHPVRPQLPDLWQPWLDAIAEAFEAKRASLEQIRDREQHFRTMAESHPVPVAIVGVDDRTILHASQAFADLFRLPLEQVHGMNAEFFYVEPEERRRLVEQLRAAHGAVQGFETRARRADGTVFPAALTSRLIDVEGRQAIVSAIVDLSEQKQAEAQIIEQREALRQSEQRFRTIAEAHPVPVSIVRRADRKVLYASAPFAELLHISREELYRLDSRRFYAKIGERLKVSGALRRHGAVRNVEITARRPDGTTFPAAITCELIDYEGEPAVISSVVDLTELKRVERELRESEQRFRVLAEAHPVPLFIVDLQNDTFLFASPPCAELLRMPLRDLIGGYTPQFYADLADRQPILEKLRRDGAINAHEVRLRRADGTEFWGAFTSRLITFQGREALVTAVIDLTERKQAEAEIARQREALHQSEKLNALGSLLASVAHELNNPLSVVVGYATMLRDMSTDPTTRERSIKIQAAAERCARIVRTFLAMARQKPAARGPVQVNQIIEAALEVAGYGLRTAGIEVVLDLDPALPEISADADQLTLVLTNLLVNAQHAVQTHPAPRRIEISSRQENGALRIDLADNGPGIPAEIAARIFEPFFTTKPQGVGTGIGLSVSRNIITAHGGEITAAAGPGGGARFSVVLPIVTSEQVAVTSEPAPASVPGRVLIVEDEAEVADMLAEILTRDGHQVTIATSGQDALRQLRGNGVDLIISDLRMPDLDGPGLHRALVERAPALAQRLVFITGDTLAADASSFLGSTGLPVIEKPVDPYDFRVRVRTYLTTLRGREGTTSTPAEPPPVS
jgi:PAS domain S-box-containing protein